MRSSNGTWEPQGVITWCGESGGSPIFLASSRRGTDLWEYIVYESSWFGLIKKRCWTNTYTYDSLAQACAALGIERPK